MPPPAVNAAIATPAATTPGTADLASRIESVPGTITQLPIIQQINEVVPAADLLFGGLMLAFIILLHATFVHHMTGHVARRSAAIMRQPARWRASLLICGVVFSLLALHSFEIWIWAAALVHSGLVAEWKAAGFFAASAFTTVGFGNDILPNEWRMLGPIIAISGLFTFGWSGSVLVDLVGRSQKITEAVELQAAGKSGNSAPR